MLRIDAASWRLAGVLGVAQEVAQVAAGGVDRLGLGFDHEVDAADLVVHLGGAEFVGRELLAGRGLDQRRAAHADRRVAGRDHHVGEAGDARVAGERATGDDGNGGHPAGQRGHAVERAPAAAEPRAPAAEIVSARAAAVGEADQRPAAVVGQLNQAVELPVIERGLGAALHGVVVRRDGHRRAVDRADALHQAVGRADDVAVGRDREHAVFDERVFVEQHRDALAGGELAAGVDFGDGVGARIVHRRATHLQHLFDQLVVHRRAPHDPPHGPLNRPLNGRANG